MSNCHNPDLRREELIKTQPERKTFNLEFLYTVYTFLNMLEHKSKTVKGSFPCGKDANTTLFIIKYGK